MLTDTRARWALRAGNGTGIRRWRQWTLRARLVLVVGALTAVALLVANVAGLLLIRDYLHDRIDGQLRAVSLPLGKQPPPSHESEDAAAGTNKLRSVPKTLGPDQVTYWFHPTGLAEWSRLSAAESAEAAAALPAVPALRRVAEIPVLGEPYTVVAEDGSRWRMIAVRNDVIQGYAVGAVSLDELEQTSDRLLLIGAAVSLLVLVLLGFVASFVVRLGLRPLNDMERLATDISGGNLTSRVAGADPHTEPGRLGLALNAMLGRIEAEVGARTASESRMRQFLADASHELRTPLTSIRGFAELHRRGGVAPGPALDRIESEAGRMSRLVEDMLKLARLDQQRPLDRRPVDLLEVAAGTVRDAYARSPARVVHLSGPEGDEPPVVPGDEHALRQVAANLVTNALQHTPSEAEITVRVGWSPARPPAPGSVVSGPATPAAGRYAVLEVSDNGPGIPPEHAPRVFERLYRADPSRHRGQGGGSGLGLSIVAAVVHGHGGWVELEQSPGGGATFRVLLPA